MPALSRLVGALAVLLVLSGCGAGDAMREGQAVAEALFAARRDGRVAEVNALYGAQFFQVTSREQWDRIGAVVDRRLGPPESHSLASWNVHFEFGAAAGTYVSLAYRVRYARGEGAESIVVFTPDEGRPSIVGHHFDSPALLDESLQPPDESAPEGPAGA